MQGVGFVVGLACAKPNSRLAPFFFFFGERGLVMITPVYLLTEFDFAERFLVCFLLVVREAFSFFGYRVFSFVYWRAVGLRQTNRVK